MTIKLMCPRSSHFKLRDKKMRAIKEQVNGGVDTNEPKYILQVAQFVKT